MVQNKEFTILLQPKSKEEVLIGYVLFVEEEKVNNYYFWRKPNVT